MPFRIDYVNTIKLPEGIADEQVSAIDTEKRALLAPERIGQIVGYILGTSTRRPDGRALPLSGKARGFNAFRHSLIEAMVRTPEFRSSRGTAARPEAQGRDHLLACGQRGDGRFPDEEGLRPSLDQLTRLSTMRSVTQRDVRYELRHLADRFGTTGTPSLRLKQREIDRPSS